MADEQINFKIRFLNMPIGNVLRRGKPGVPKDGDGDGMFTPVGSTEDNMPQTAAVDVVMNFLRKKTPSYKNELSRRRRKAEEIITDAKGGGFTRDPNLKGDIKTGIAVGLNRHGLSKKVSDIWDENGNPKEEAIRTVLAWMQYHNQKVFNNPSPGARERGVGGWVEDVDGVPHFFLDVVDIYPTTEENLDKAAFLGRQQNQKAVTILEKIWEAKDAEERKEEADWKAPFVKSGGDGADVIDWDFFKEARDVFAEPKRNISRIFRPFRQGKSDDYSLRIVVSEREENG